MKRSEKNEVARELSVYVQKKEETTPVPGVQVALGGSRRERDREEGDLAQHDAFGGLYKRMMDREGRPPTWRSDNWTQSSIVIKVMIKIAREHAVETLVAIVASSVKSKMHTAENRISRFGWSIGNHSPFMGVKTLMGSKPNVGIYWRL